MEHGRSGFSDETSFGGRDADIVRRKKWSMDAQVFPTKRLLEARMPTCEEEKMEHGRSGFSDETSFGGRDADM